MGWKVKPGSNTLGLLSLVSISVVSYFSFVFNLHQENHYWCTNLFIWRYYCHHALIVSGDQLLLQASGGLEDLMLPLNVKNYYEKRVIDIFIIYKRILQYLSW